MWSVAIYLVDRSFGGPEEGGWYYSEGDLVHPDELSVEGWTPGGVFGKEDEAIEFCDGLQRALDAGPNKSRRPISSVLSTGRYRAMIHSGWPPQHFPDTRPHYE
jgi:hypothetical protein